MKVMRDDRKVRVRPSRYDKLSIARASSGDQGWTRRTKAKNAVNEVDVG